MCVRGIFYESYAIAVGQILKPVEIRRMPTHVHRDNGFGPGRDRRFGQCRVKAIASRSTSTRTGRALANSTALAVAINVKFGTMTSCRAPRLMPPGHFQRRRAVGHSDAMSGAVIGGKCLLKLQRLGSGVRHQYTGSPVLP